MEANKIREIVNEVNPPVRGKPMTLTNDLSNEISQTTPFWAALLRKRDIRDAEGGDEYVTGLIETFCRIYVALKAHNTQSVLVPLDLNTLYTLDAELQKNDMGLADEYPALEMVGVSEQGSFGAGTLMAYALFETALAIQGNPRSPAEPAQKIGAAVEDVSSAQSVADDLLAGLPTEELTVNPPIPQYFDSPKGDAQNTPSPEESQKSDPPPWNWARNHAQIGPQPLLLLGVYQTPNALVVKGDLPNTLSGAAQTHNLVKGIFGTDAAIAMGPRGLEFSFSFTKKGELP